MNENYTNLKEIFIWGIRTKLCEQKPHALSAPWYDTAQREAFRHGQIKGKELLLREVITGGKCLEKDYSCLKYVPSDYE